MCFFQSYFSVRLLPLWNIITSSPNWSVEDLCRYGPSNSFHTFLIYLLCENKCRTDSSVRVCADGTLFTLRYDSPACWAIEAFRSIQVVFFAILSSLAAFLICTLLPLLLLIYEWYKCMWYTAPWLLWAQLGRYRVCRNASPLPSCTSGRGDYSWLGFRWNVNRSTCIFVWIALGNACGRPHFNLSYFECQTL